MNNYFIKTQEFDGFLSKMISSKTVFGPVAKQTKFMFAKLDNPQQLRLDYDVTILPPKKQFFPPTQDVCHFNKDKYEGCVNPQESILFGVHYYDIKAIDMTDFLFRENKSDVNYLANRNATTVVGSNIQNVSNRAFWASVGKEVEPKGHDAFLTKIDDGYVLETRTAKGEALTKLGNFQKASDAQVKKAHEVNEKVKEQCKEKLVYSSKQIADRVRAEFKNEGLWDKLSEDCFSCGSCNTTCPTCYCFDVQDNWSVDQISGARTRTWDSCLTEDFAKVSLGAGHSENFRESRGQRMRHRMMRKATYLNTKLGGPACVGCGRCSSACVADIADPVNIINKIMGA
jgi:sulfhydrogenase subunit beta (sulfur reductase)